jgi:preprotein translocase subunit SecY
MAIRRIPVQYARRTSGDFEQDMVVMDRWIPLKLNAQVMPPLSLPLFNQLIQSIVGAFSNMFGFGIICLQL